MSPFNSGIVFNATLSCTIIFQNMPNCHGNQGQCEMIKKKNNSLFMRWGKILHLLPDGYYNMYYKHISIWMQIIHVIDQ